MNYTRYLSVQTFNLGDSDSVCLVGLKRVVIFNLCAVYITIS